MAKQIRPAVVGFTGPADIRAISECHGKLLQALQRNKSVQLDLSETAEPDLTFVQLIEAARRFGAATGRSIALTQPVGEVLREILTRGGFLGAPDARAFWLHETRTN